VGLLLPSSRGGVGPAALSVPAQDDVWSAYVAAGRPPDFAALSVAARAITPTDSPLRFDTRFVVAEAEAACRVHGGDGELSDIGWIPVARCDGLDLPAATRGAIAAAVRLRKAAAAGRPSPPMARLTWRVDAGGTLRACADARRA
jgi:hypothetical protein